jgi:hypothetical protein
MSRRGTTPSRTEAFVRHVRYFEDVLEMIRMLVVYFGRNPKAKRLQVTDVAIKRALRILGCYTSKGPEWKQRNQQLGKDWESNLLAAGIDPKTLEIIDERRCALAWAGGLQNKKPEFYARKVNEQYERGEFIRREDALQPEIITIDPKKKRKSKDATYEAQAQSNHLSQVLWSKVRPAEINRPPDVTL